MKHYIKTIFLIVVIATSTTVNSQTFNKSTLVFADDINVRDSASTKSNVIGVLAKYTEVSISKDRDIVESVVGSSIGKWIPINYNNTKGYIWNSVLADAVYESNLSSSDKVIVNFSHSKILTLEVRNNSTTKYFASYSFKDKYAISRITNLGISENGKEEILVIFEDYQSEIFQWDGKEITSINNELYPFETSSESVFPKGVYVTISTNKGLTLRHLDLNKEFNINVGTDLKTDLVLNKNNGKVYYTNYNKFLEYDVITGKTEVLSNNVPMPKETSGLFIDSKNSVYLIKVEDVTDNRRKFEETSTEKIENINDYYGEFSEYYQYKSINYLFTLDADKWKLVKKEAKAHFIEDWSPSVIEAYPELNISRNNSIIYLDDRSTTKLKFSNEDYVSDRFDTGGEYYGNSEVSSYAYKKLSRDIPKLDRSSLFFDTDPVLIGLNKYTYLIHGISVGDTPHPSGPVYIYNFKTNKVTNLKIDKDDVVNIYIADNYMKIIIHYSKTVIYNTTTMKKVEGIDLKNVVKLFEIN